eukprot:scaffold101020_cov33-Phaeocystis_antarctica.AAC.1
MLAKVHQARHEPREVGDGVEEDLELVGHRDLFSSSSMSSLGMSADMKALTVGRDDLGVLGRQRGLPHRPSR